MLITENLNDRMELFSISKEIEHIPFFEYMICFKEHMAWRLNKPFKVDKPRSYPTSCDQITYNCTVALATLYHFLWNIVSFHNLFPLIAGLQLKSRRLSVDKNKSVFPLVELNSFFMPVLGNDW